MTKQLIVIAAIGLALGGAIASSAGTIPAGTKFVVRTTSTIHSNDRVGKQFTATLDRDIVVQGKVVARAGLKFSGRIETSNNIGSARLTANLTGINSGGKIIPIRTAGAFGPKSVGYGRQKRVTSDRFTLAPGSTMEFSLAQPVSF